MPSMPFCGKNGPQESNRCKQKVTKHTARGPDPRSAAASLEAHIVELTNQLHVLKLEREKLNLRQKVFTGMWLATRQAVKVLDSSIQWGCTDEIKRAFDSAQGLETALLQSVEAGGDPIDPLETWTAALQPSPGAASELLLSFVDAANVFGPSESSVLGGAPCSLLLAVLLCLQYDPLFVQQSIKTREKGPEAVVAAAAKTNAEATQIFRDLLDRAASAPIDSPESALIHSSIAVQALSLSRALVSGAVLFQAGGLDHIYHKGVGMGTPAAKLDEIADKMLITQEQVLSMLKEQSMYKEILAPLAKEKSELLASISQALAAKDPHPAATAAAAGGAMLAPFPTTGSAASGISSNTAYSQVAAAAAGSSSSSVTIPGPISAAAAETGGVGLLSHEISHLELLQQLSRVDVIQAQLWWLDMCCSFSCFGKFTWWQLGTMNANFAPHPPGAAGLLVRRLVSRTSLMLMLPGLPHPRVDGLLLGGSDVPWHVVGATAVSGTGSGSSDS